MENTAKLIIKAIEATGALLTGIIALISVPKLVKNTMFKEEKYIGNEAIERYIEKKIVKVEVYYLKKNNATMPNIILRKK